MRFFLPLLLLLPAPAFAAKVMLMVNLNYSSAELKAAESMAQARGQELIVVPPREMVPEVEPLTHQRDDDAELIKQMYPDLSDSQIRSALNGIMNDGADWQGNQEVSSVLGPVEMNKLRRTAQKIFAKERDLGSIYGQLEKKLTELAAKGAQVDAVVYSSHSDGAYLTGETTNRLSSRELYDLKKDHPEAFDSVRHVMLMGCYGLADPNRVTWRELYPTASMIAGYGLKAPSRFDKASANFIREMLTKADALDHQLAGGGPPLSAATLTEAFRTLEAFTDKRHPGVVDYCYHLIQGRPGATLDCDGQWAQLYEKKAEMTPYFNPNNTTNDPVCGSDGEIRAFYNVLQTTCLAKNARSEKDDAASSENMRVLLREMMIRLINWCNVQQNFATYYASEIQNMNRRLARAGAPAMPTLDGTVGRVAFTQAYQQADRALQENRALQRDFRDLYKTLLLLHGEASVAEGDSLSVEETLARGAIPFNWIEGNTAGGAL